MSYVAEMRNALVLGGGVAVLAACAVGKDYARPELAVAPNWIAAEQAPSVVPGKPAENAPWWTLFEDKTLNQLIEQALANNHDLKIAEARIAEAQANEALSDSSLFPQINATATGARSTMGGFLEDRLDNTRQYGVGGSWEIDLFGGNRRRSEAAEAGTQAAVADADETKLRLIAEVARSYVRLRGLQEQRALTQRNIALQEETVTITQAQYRARVVSRLDILRARSQMKTTRTRLPEIDAEIYAAMNRLAVLLGEPVAAMKERLSTPGAIPHLPSKIVAAAAIDTIERRPDIRAAERRLAQATALSGAAFAGYFPKLSLEGFFGASRSDAYGGSGPWNVTANALLPLLNFGRIQAQVDSADAQETQAYHAFRQRVLLAVEQVEVSFSSYLRETERQAMYADIAQEQTTAAQIAREQYINGMAPQIDLLDAEQNTLSAQTNAVLSRAAAADNLIVLYTALGSEAADTPTLIPPADKR